MQASAKGRVLWLTGLAGSGKTTIGRRLADRLQRAGQPVVFLDGDGLRELFGRDLGHSPAERRRLAGMYGRLCRLLSGQGITVVCATISLFHEVHDWNRRHIPGYTEVYLKVPMVVLRERDQKGLYSRALRGAVDNVMGVDLPMEEPRNPDLVVLNDGNATPDEILDQILLHLGWRQDRSPANADTEKPGDL